MTGLGLVSPVGLSLRESWASIKAMKSGIKQLASDGKDFSKVPVRIGATISEAFDTASWNDPQTSTKLPRVIQYSLCAATEALTDAGLTSNDSAQLKADLISPERLGVCLGTGIGNLEGICTSNDSLQTRGINRISPFFVPNILCNGAAGHVAKRFQAKALLHSVSTACTT